MKYKLFRVISTTIGNQSITCFEELPNSIEWRKYNYGKNMEDTSGYVSNSFNSPEECYTKVKELFERRKNEDWDDFTLENYHEYTCLPILKF